MRCVGAGKSQAEACGIGGHCNAGRRGLVGVDDIVIGIVCTRSCPVGHGGQSDGAGSGSGWIGFGGVVGERAGVDDSISTFERLMPVTVVVHLSSTRLLAGLRTSA